MNLIILLLVLPPVYPPPEPPDEPAAAACPRRPRPPVSPPALRTPEPGRSRPTSATGNDRVRPHRRTGPASLRGPWGTARNRGFEPDLFPALTPLGRPVFALN
jgi:hypothetical protein